jgi:hypothetical protein
MFRHIFQQEYVLHDALSGSKVDLMMRTLVLMLSFPTRVFVALVLMLSCANAPVPDCCNY